MTLDIKDFVDHITAAVTINDPIAAFESEYLPCLGGRYYQLSMVASSLPYDKANTLLAEAVAQAYREIGPPTVPFFAAYNPTVK